MAWKKSPESLVARFHELAPQEAGVQLRPMFGYPACFVNGNMFTGLFQDRWLVRLGADAVAELLAIPDAAPFEPMPGRPMRGFVLLPPDFVDDEEAIRPWLARALAHARSMPPKGAGKAKPKGRKPAVSAKRAPAAAGRRAPRAAAPRKAPSRASARRSRSRR